MQDLYKGFKKTAEDDHSAMLEHESGHTLKIAKSGLSRKQVAALSKLPLHQAKGPQEVEMEQPAMPDAGDQAKAVGVNIADAVANKILEGATEAATPKFVDTLPQAPQPKLSAHKTAVPMPTMPAAPMEQQPAITPQEKQNLAQYTQQQAVEPPQQPAPEEQPSLAEEPAREVTAEPVQAAPKPAAPETTAAPAAQPTAALQTQMPAPAVGGEDPLLQLILDPKTPPSQKAEAYLLSSLKKRQEAEKADREFYEKMKTQEISAPTLMHDRSTLGKIGTVMAMALSGLGAGITGKENMVLQLLQDQINKEIDAQKRNDERKFSLQKFHSEQLQNSAAADLKTANDLLNIGKIQLEEQLQGWKGSPMARKRYEAVLSELNAKITENNVKQSQLLVNQDLKKSFSRQSAAAQPVSAGTDKRNPITLLAQLDVDKDLRKDAVNEIASRQKIIRAVPKLLDKMEKTFDAYHGFGLIKKPEAIKDLELTIRNSFPAQKGEDEKTRDAREATIQSLLALLIPERLDLMDKKDYMDRLYDWMTENTAITPAISQIQAKYPGFDLEQFDTTSLDKAIQQKLKKDVSSQKEIQAPPGMVQVEDLNGKRYYVKESAFPMLKAKLPFLKVIRGK